MPEAITTETPVQNPYFLFHAMSNRMKIAIVIPSAASVTYGIIKSANAL
jgi:hypothetical protein